MIVFDVDSEEKKTYKSIKINVVGIGGAGGNTINNMIDKGVENISFMSINTDAQALMNSRSNKKIQVGLKTTKGLGSGANPDIGKKAVEEDIDKIMQELENSDIVFLTAGMGGGTGSGGAPIIAKALQEKNILTIAIVTKPFLFEGKKRLQVAEKSIEELKQYVDTLIIVPNQKLLEIEDSGVTMIESFAKVHQLILQSVKSISDIITRPGHINVDFADLKLIMKGMGLAIMGTGNASGENRAKNAAKEAISSPLIESVNIKHAQGILLNITAGENLSLHEINDAANVIYDQSNKNSHIIIGSVIDTNLKDEIFVSVIITGLEKQISLATSSDKYYQTAFSEPESLQKNEKERDSSVHKNNLQEAFVLNVVEKNNTYNSDVIETPAFMRKQKEKE